MVLRTVACGPLILSPTFCESPGISMDIQHQPAASTSFFSSWATHPKNMIVSRGARRPKSWQKRRWCESSRCGWQHDAGKTIWGCVWRPQNHAIRGKCFWGYCFTSWKYCLVNVCNNPNNYCFLEYILECFLALGSIRTPTLRLWNAPNQHGANFLKSWAAPMGSSFALGLTTCRDWLRYLEISVAGNLQVGEIWQLKCVSTCIIPMEHVVSILSESNIYVILYDIMLNIHTYIHDGLQKFVFSWFGW